MKQIKVIALLIGLWSIALSQTERWVYRYNGTGNYNDQANSVVYGSDGNIYTCGASSDNRLFYDFFIASLTNAGSGRWVYRHDGTLNLDDEARSIVYGADGNIYACGYFWQRNAIYDFTVISLTNTGSERWVYTDSGTLGGNDEAYSLVYGADGNIYVAGYLSNSGSIEDLTVISLTNTGSKRWVYSYNTPGNWHDFGYSIVYGFDGNIYVAGKSDSSGTSDNFTVVSLTNAGTHRWVYKYNGPSNLQDWAASLVYGEDGNLYAVGTTTSSSSGENCLIISLTNAGAERWVYTVNGSANSNDRAYSIVYGSDGNIYLAGQVTNIITGKDFSIVSLTNAGGERWRSRYDGPANLEDEGNSLVYDANGNIFACGWSSVSSVNFDFTVVSVTNSGNLRGVYTYDGPANGNDRGTSIACGSDGNIYAAGFSTGTGGSDLTVISLNPVAGSIKETVLPKIDRRFSLFTSTIQNKNLKYSLSLPEPVTISFSLYKPSGEKILLWQTKAPIGVSRYAKNLPDLSPGIYFLSAEVCEKGYKENRKLVILK